MSKRKAFNFYNSYYETAKLLDDKERLKFYDIMMEKQFYGVEPKGLKGTLLLVWTSLKHSINAQIKGFEDKTGERLQVIENHPSIPPLAGPTEPPAIQEKEKGQEKEEEQSCLEFEKFWNLYDKKVGTSDCKKKFEKLSKLEKEKIFETLPLYIKSTPEKKFRKNPKTYLNGSHWEDEISPVSETKTIVAQKPTPKYDYTNS